MKITTNEFGNYIPKINHCTVPQEKPVEIQKKIAKTDLGTISSEEKKFFAKLYPEKTDDVMNYHFYQKTGKMQGVALGTLFDKRG